jgi:hypothetical protein
MLVLESTSPLRPLGNSVLDRHRFDANPDPTFHFDPDLESDPDPTPSFTHVGESGKKNLIFIHITASLHC